MNFQMLHTVTTSPPSPFDGIVLVVLFLGALKGRKNGLSLELMVCLQWVTIVLAGAFLYRSVGDMMIANKVPLSHLACYMIAYIGIAMAVKMIFSLLKKGIGGKLVEQSLFGSMEYYLGMVAGAVRFTCIMLAALALLNARSFTQQEISKNLAAEIDLYGSTFFPSLASLQSTVFKDSFAGRELKQYGSKLLITPTSPEEATIRRAQLPDYQSP
jgi:uncharacterized membrane protein required for colicin V production